MLAYRYRVLDVARVVDGDTVDLRLDLGFHVSITERFRLARIDTPELVGADRARAMEASAWLETELRRALPGRLFVTSDKLDKFRRWLGTLWIAGEDGRLRDVNAELVDAGLARPYPG